MSDTICHRTRKDRRAWDRELKRLAKRARLYPGLACASLVPLALFLVAPGALALPVGGHVVSGSVAIGQPAPNAMTITQGSQNAIVNWNSFSIAAGEAVNIKQPSASAVILNRVLGNNATSIIEGHLTANG